MIAIHTINITNGKFLEEMSFLSITTKVLHMGFASKKRFRVTLLNM